MDSPWISPECGVMQGVETVVVGQGYVGVVVQEQRQHVVSFLRYGVVKWCITFQILKQNDILLELQM